MIYVIGGMKYSVGKTRTSVNFSIHQSTIKQRKVLLIDADPSAFASEYISWVKLNKDVKDIDSVKILNKSLPEYINNLEEEYDDIIIDSGLGENLLEAMKIADRLIIPFNSKDLALWVLWSLTNIETMIENASSYNGKLKAYSFLISDPEGGDLDKGLVKTLKNSQFLTYLESPLVKEMLAGTDKDALKSLKNFKAKPVQDQLSSITESEL